MRANVSRPPAISRATICAVSACCTPTSVGCLSNLTAAAARLMASPSSSAARSGAARGRPRPRSARGGPLGPSPRRRRQGPAGRRTPRRDVPARRSVPGLRPRLPAGRDPRPLPAAEATVVLGGLDRLDRQRRASCAVAVSPTPASGPATAPTHVARASSHPGSIDRARESRRRRRARSPPLTRPGRGTRARSCRTWTPPVRARESRRSGPCVPGSCSRARRDLGPPRSGPVPWPLSPPARAARPPLGRRPGADEHLEGLGRHDAGHGDRVGPDEAQADLGDHVAGRPIATWTSRMKPVAEPVLGGGAPARRGSAAPPRRPGRRRGSAGRTSRARSRASPAAMPAGRSLAPGQHPLGALSALGGAEPTGHQVAQAPVEDGEALVAHQIAPDRLQGVPQPAERLVEHLGQLRVSHAAVGGDEGAQHVPGHVAEFGVGQRGELVAEEVIGVAAGGCSSRRRSSPGPRRAIASHTKRANSGSPPRPGCAPG